MYYDIIIIGGGASGLCTAITAKTRNSRILILDKDIRPGKKILSTGNGKCNLTNTYCDVSLFYKNPEKIYPYFTSGAVAFIEDIIRRFNWHDTVHFFEELGILLINKNGYIYPRTEQASTVLEALKKRAADLDVEVIPAYGIKNICKKDGLFVIDERFRAKNLVLATGGLSSPKNDADRFGYETAQSFGHSVLKPRPALCALACRSNVFRNIAGVRADGVVTLLDENRSLVIKSHGNIQFTDYGISGIPVFQISSEAGRLFEEGKKPLIEIDFFPDKSEDELAALIKGRKKDFLFGIMNSSLAKTFEALTAVEFEGTDTDLFIRGLCRLVKHFTVLPDSLPPFKKSQVTAGGIPTWEIDETTLESKFTKGLYFTGEIIDVNGICGGYNLQWAWSTGFICGSALKAEYDKDNIIKDKS